jgi:hypothetical protein
VKQMPKRRSLIIFVEAYGQVKVPLFVAFTKKGLLPLLLRKSSRTNVTLTRIRRPPKKKRRRSRSSSSSSSSSSNVSSLVSVCCLG